MFHREPERVLEVQGLRSSIRFIVKLLYLVLFVVLSCYVASHVLAELQAGTQARQLSAEQLHRFQIVDQVMGLVFALSISSVVCAFFFIHRKEPLLVRLVCWFRSLRAS